MSVPSAARLGTVIMALSVIPLALGGCTGTGPERLQSRAASPRGPDVPVVVRANEPVLVGISAPISGPDAAAGTEDRDAAIVAVERWKKTHGRELRGHAIEVVVEDDGCTDSATTELAARRLVDRAGLVGVVGPNCSAGALAALPVYADAGVVAVSGSATRTDLTLRQPGGRFFLRTAYRNSLEGSLIGLFASFDLKAESGYLVDDSEAYGQDLASNAQRILEANRVKVTRASVTRGTVQFDELVTRIVRDNPTFVGFLGFNPEAALFYRQLRDAGYRGVFGSGDAAATRDFIAAIGKQSEGVLFAGCQLGLPRDFVDEFRRVHGNAPGSSAFVAQNVDAMTALLDGIASAARSRSDGALVISPMVLRDAVRTAGLTGGVSGSFGFDGYGDRVPRNRAEARGLVDAALASQDLSAFVDLGLVPCQVQGGKLVRLIGPGAKPRR